MKWLLVCEALRIELGVRVPSYCYFYAGGHFQVCANKCLAIRAPRVGGALWEPGDGKGGKSRMRSGPATNAGIKLGKNGNSGLGQSNPPHPTPTLGDARVTQRSVAKAPGRPTAKGRRLSELASRGRVSRSHIPDPTRASPGPSWRT